MPSFDMETNGNVPSELPDSGGMNGKYVSQKEVGDTIYDEIDKKEEEEDKKKEEKEDKKKEAPPMVGVGEVFRFSTTKDYLFMLVGTIAACAHGAANPLMIIVFGNVSDLFVNQSYIVNVIRDALDAYNQACSTLSCTTLASLTTTAVTIVRNFTVALPTWSLPVISTPTMLPNFNCTCPPLTEEWILAHLVDFVKYLRLLGLDEAAAKVESAVMDNFMDQMQTYALYYTYLGIGVLCVGYLQMMSWHMAAYNQSERIRTSLFRAILKQDIAWFDTHDIGELNTRLVDDVELLEKGIGDKLALFFQYTSAFVAGFIIGFVYGWELTLVILSVSPLLAISGGVMSKLVSSMTKKELQAYATAGAVAEEVFGSIRTVTAFGGQQKESARYSSKLEQATKFGIRKGIVNGVGMGAVFLVMFGSYALAFWYGSTLVIDKETYSVGTMMVVFFSVLIGAFSIGAASPNIQDFANARGAAYAIYNIIDLKPSIDSSSTEGLKPEKLIGNIEFRNVVFKYPARLEVPVLNGLNLKVNVGQTVALVGSSGCGKSTTVQLIQRFYDLLDGQILIDGIDLKDFNVKWLRQHIGVVSQEPILFGTTIAENIRYGKDGVSMAEIENAAKEANAHDFIVKLPDKYETLVGERGAQLSGGQKQRIAIARALVRNPTILLLDEATSALDTESEATVQAALDRARLGRTTIIVAHRLSTVQTADIIAGISDGVVVEQGSHEELMKRSGVYYLLVTNQQQASDEDKDEDVTTKSVQKVHSVKTDKVALQRLRTLSQGDNQEDKIVVEEKDEKLPDPPMSRIIKLNSPEWFYILIGCISATVMGVTQPLFAIIFSNIVGVFSVPDVDYQREKCNFYSGMFAVIGVITATAQIGMNVMFAKSGEYLTVRLRRMAFSSFLRQEMAYFDDHKNSVGALCSRLATDASAVKGATGTRLALVLQSLASIGGGMAIGFIYSWKLTLVVLAFAPFMVVSGIIEMKIFAGDRGERSKKLEQAAKIATETIENIRTVATLTQEEKFYQQYCALIAVPYAANRRKAHFVGVAYSFSQAIVYFANAACFMYGAHLVKNEGLDVTSMFKVFSAIIFGAMAAGQASSFAPDYGKAKTAAARLFILFDRVPEIDSSSEEGLKPDTLSGSVKLVNVRFTYPTRPDIEILKGIDINVEPGQVVALVGSSGCGKSTIVQLLERFYDPTKGQVFVDGNATDNLHIQWLRSQIGIVSQEPVLFDCSIQENIAYGDNFRHVSMDEIIEAAKQANIHNFIDSLPLGYETNVGDKGTQLSGGQKQRVAIARALVRKPKILLLDEATSALDTESEKIVQEALERAQQGRTSIVIAHRLSTIQNADCIVVIHNGKIVETGTHSELLNQKGFYYRLNVKQSKQT